MMPFGPKFFGNIVIDVLLHMKAEVFAKTLYIFNINGLGLGSARAHGIEKIIATK